MESDAARGLATASLVADADCWPAPGGRRRGVEARATRAARSSAASRPLTPALSRWERGEARVWPAPPAAGAAWKPPFDGAQDGLRASAGDPEPAEGPRPTVGS